MKKTDKITYQQKSLTDLTRDLADIQKQLVEVRVKQATGNQKDTSVLAKLKYKIAFLKTLITQNSKQQ